MNHRDNDARGIHVTVRDDAAAIAGDIARLRHSIHRQPEIGLDLPMTQQKVLAALDGLPLEISTGKELTSVTAVLRGRRPGQTVLLRADMDALPVTEATGLPFASQISGAMHACGHDLHTAMLVGAARLLSARRAELDGNVIFMFQPGEEGYAGAGHMISEGVLDAAGDRPAAAYALHVSSELPCGVFSTRPGAMMAADDRMTVTVRGRGGHAAMPHSALDPIPAAAEMVTALQAMVTRRFDVFDPVVLTVATIHAGTAFNVIPHEATFSAIARSYSAASRRRLREESQRLLADIARGHGLTADPEYVEGYPVTVNDPAEAAFAAATAARVFGAERAVEAQHPATASEDFAFVLEQVPGAFIRLGARPPAARPAAAPPNHSPAAVFDDDALACGTALHVELALGRLSAPRSGTTEAAEKARPDCG